MESRESHLRCRKEDGLIKKRRDRRRERGSEMHSKHVYVPSFLLLRDLCYLHLYPSIQHWRDTTWLHGNMCFSLVLANHAV